MRQSDETSAAEAEVLLNVSRRRSLGRAFAGLCADREANSGKERERLAFTNDRSVRLTAESIYRASRLMRLFDAGYVTFDEDFRFVVSDRVRSDFNNGEEYRRLHGQRLNLPARASHQPERDVLNWHNLNKFLG